MRCMEITGSYQLARGFLIYESLRQMIRQEFAENQKLVSFPVAFDISRMKLFGQCPSSDRFDIIT